VSQSITSANFTTFLSVASGTLAFDPACAKVRTQSISTSAGLATLGFTAPGPGTYVIAIKYSAARLAGAQAPPVANPTVRYLFSTTLNATPFEQRGLMLGLK
jgi:hypothetical protein